MARSETGQSESIKMARSETGQSESIKMARSETGQSASLGNDPLEQPRLLTTFTAARAGSRSLLHLAGQRHVTQCLLLIPLVVG